MTDKYTPPGDLERAQRKREARAEFIRQFLLNAVRAGRSYVLKGNVCETVRGEEWTSITISDARIAWDAIESEASK